MPTKNLARLVPLVLCAAFVAGCGGNDEAGNGETTMTTVPTAEIDVGRNSQVSVTLRARRTQAGGQTGDESTNLAVRPGDQVQLVTRVVDGTPEGAGVKVEIPLGSASTHRVTAGGLETDPAATLQIRGVDGASVKLADVRYVCRVDEATFCPVDVEVKNEQALLRTKLRTKRPPVPIVVTASVERG